jgi:hypothetical protein
MTRAARVLACSWLLLLPAPAPAQETPPPPPAEEAPLVAPAEAQAGVEAVPLTLRHRWVQGAKLVYEQRQTMEVDQGPMGRVEMQTAFELEREVREVRADGATVRETYRQVVQEVVAQGQKLTLDTRDGTRSGNPGVDCLEAMVGGALDLTVKASGEIERVTGAAGIVERVAGACPEEMRELMATQLAETMNDEALARQFQEALLVPPEGELQPGAAWRRQGKFPVPPVGDLERTIDYVYLGAVERAGVRCAKLWMRTRVAGVEGRQTEIQGQPAVVGLTGFEGQTALLVRADDGEIVEFGPLEVQYTLSLQVAGQDLSIGYRVLSRVEARDGAPAPAPAPDAPR